MADLPDGAHTLPEIHVEVAAFVQAFVHRTREVADVTTPHLPTDMAGPVFFQACRN